MKPTSNNLTHSYYDAEGGVAWTLLFPKFQMVVPVPDVAKTPLAYPVGGGDKEFADFFKPMDSAQTGKL